MSHKCLVESSTICGFGFKDTSFKTICSTGAWWIFPRPVVFCSELEDTKQDVPQMPGEFFHDLWSLLQKILRKTECSIGDLWIFSQITCGFSSEKLKDYVNSQRFKRKRKYKEERQGETVRGERENHLSKGERVGKDKRVHGKKLLLLLPLGFVCCFGYRLEFFISVCRTNFFLLED